MTAPLPFGRLGRDTLIYGGGILLGRVVSFIMLPIYTRFLTPADYGVLQLITVTIDVIEIFAASRLASGIFYLFHKAESNAERRTVLSTALVVMLFSYCVAGAAAYATAGPIGRVVFAGDGYAGLLRIAAGSLACEALIIVPLAYLQVSGYSIRFVTVNLVKLVLQVTLNIVFLVVLRLGVKAVLLSTLLTNLVVGIGLTGYLVSEVGLKVSWPTTRSLLRFGLPLVAVHMATFISTFGDRYFLKAEGNTTVVGLYSLAYQFGFLLATVGLVPFNTVWEPARFAIAKRPDRDDVYAKAFIYFNLLLLSVAVGIALFVGDVLQIMSAPSYWGAANLVPVILVAYVLQSWTEIHNLGIMMRERTELITWANWVAAGVALGGYAWLIPRYLGLGAALATVLAFGVREIMVYVLSQRLWPVRYRWGPVLRLSAVAIAVCVARRFVPEDGGLLNSLGWSMLLLALYGLGVLYAGVVTAEERGRFYRAVRAPRAALVAFVARP